MFNPETTKIIYYYTDLTKVAAQFDGTDIYEQRRRFLDFWHGFETGVSNRQAILAHLEPTERQSLQGQCW